MVASREVEIPFYRGVGRQRGRGFGVLAQVIGRTAIPFLRKYNVPAAKRAGADLFEFAVPEIAEVVSGRENFRTAAEIVGRQTLRKQLGEGSRRRTGGSRKRKGALGGRELSYGRQASRFIPTKSAKKPVGREETFFQTFLINHVE